MGSWDLRSFRNDLSIFITLLADSKVTGDFSQMSELLNILNTKSIIEYEIKNVAFYINGRIMGTVPDDLNYCQILLDNLLKARDPFDSNFDPLHDYKLALNINVYKGISSTNKAYCSSWHLDRHFKPHIPKYTHPMYHFQFGGKKLELIDPDMAVLSSPRIPHPPMDIFLATHFILSNFFNNQKFSFVNELLNDYDYQQIIKRAQDRLWLPYFESFNLSNSHSELIISNTFPLYLI